MYRPKGWKNPNDVFHNALDGIYSVQDAEYEAYEAGADAMYKSLQKVDTWVQVNEHESLIISPAFEIADWKNYKLVFIPKEEHDRP